MQFQSMVQLVMKHKRQAERYSIAQERLAISNDQADQAQQNVSQAIMASALAGYSNLNNNG